MRCRFSLLAAALTALVALAPLASARDLTPNETSDLSQTVERFNAAMTARDMGAIAQTIPPKVMQHIAASAGIDAETLRGVMIGQMKKALEEVEIVSFGMDLGKAEHKELPDGTPYVLIPTETVINVEPLGKTVARSATLALLDENKWYLVRVSEAQQVAMLRQVYPAFAGIEFPEGTMEPAAQ